MRLDDLPAVNACLNGLSTALLLSAWAMARRGRWRAHAVTMACALVCSALFLTFYLILHANRPPRSFTVQGPIIRPVYFAILLTHTVLAVVILPMIAMVLWRAWKRRWIDHRRLARWTLPLWLYVSVTGVVIYWMLYRM